MTLHRPGRDPRLQGLVDLVDGRRSCSTLGADDFAKLSAASVLGPFTTRWVLAAEEVADFRGPPQAKDALCLRRFDEGEKAAGLTAPPVQHFLLYVAAF